MTAVVIFIWAGASLTMIGVLLLVLCVILAIRARRAKLSDDQLRGRLRGVVTLNLGALFLSALGLMMVIVDIFLT